MEEFYVDPEAKARIPLTKIQRDANGQPYYIGKYQFPGTLDFEGGASFMIFLSEEGVEELQIAPLDPNKRLKSRRDGAGLSGGRFSIDLHPMVDQNGKTYYVGEAMGLVEMKLQKGIFFTVFVSKPGMEELQISRLNHNRMKGRIQYNKERFNRDQNEFGEEDSRYRDREDTAPRYQQGWPPRVREAL